MAGKKGREQALEALDQWADAADSPALSAPERWVDVLQYLHHTTSRRPIGLDPFVLPLA